MMQRERKPATFGGAPAFVQPVVVGRPWLPNREQVLALIGEVLDSGQLSNGGPYVAELERRVAALHDVRHCVATCNGTLALELALRAAQLTGEVAVPSFTFIATVHAVSRAGLVPVFADVGPVTHNLDPAAAERVITARTSAILGVHLWGRPCDVEGLSAVADRYGLQLLFDAAHAFGCSHRGRMIGGYGRAEVFSFHATKFFHTIEGGAVMTDDDDIAESARRQRNFGFAESLNSVMVGGNAKLNEISAAVGLSQLDGLDELAAVNHSRYELFRSEMHGVRGIHVVEYPALERSNYQHVAIEVDAGEAGIDRDGLLDVLLTENVLARPYFSPPCHLAAAYSDVPVHGLEATERLVRCTLALPTGPSLSLDDVRAVCDQAARSSTPGSIRRPAAPARSPAPATCFSKALVAGAERSVTATPRLWRPQPTFQEIFPLYWYSSVETALPFGTEKPSHPSVQCSGGSGFGTMAGDFATAIDSATVPPCARLNVKNDGSIAVNQ